ncbi:hypothetical protein NDU88_004369 [Pleurodeles waltl]|uniref:Uncharacterized protein n=1 Tax=Pleurodeles waltl TaxID=8319 RepID=A0AAV7WS48_PLEWA|nr:hypothetical protein NDU88_004369 [Pleurodeles waltl]
MLLVPVTGPTKGQPATTPGPGKLPQSGTSRRGPKSPEVPLIWLLPEIQEGPQLSGLLENLRVPTLVNALDCSHVGPPGAVRSTGPQGPMPCAAHSCAWAPPPPYLSGPTSAATPSRARTEPEPGVGPWARCRLCPNRLTGPPSQSGLQAPCRSPGHT